MASATGFGTPTPPQWTGVQTLVQNYLKSQSPEYQNFLAQQQKENQFRQSSQDLAQQQFQDTHAQNLLDTQQKQFQLDQTKRQYHLMTYNPQEAFGQDETGNTPQSGHDRYGNALGSPSKGTDDESELTGNDVGKEMGPGQPASGARVSDGEPTSFKNPQQPSSQTSTTLPPVSLGKATQPSTDSGNGFEYDIFGRKNTPGGPGSVTGSNPMLPPRQIPALKGDQKASNSLPDVPSSAVPQPDSASLGPSSRVQAIPSATTASSAAAGGDAGPSTDAARWGVHKPYSASEVRATSGEHDASTPWENLTQDEQQKVVSGYQKGAPAGTAISPTEAVRAYRMQQIARGGFSTPPNMYMKSLKVDPNTGLPSVEYEASPFGGTGQSLEGMKAAAPIIEKVNSDPNYQSFIDAQRNAESIRSHIAALKSGAFAPGISDKSIMQEYLQTVAPKVRFNEQTGEMAGGRTAGVPDEFIKLYDKVIHGAQLTDEHRNAFQAAADRNVAEHWKAAQKSIGPQLNMLRESGIPKDWIPGYGVQAPGSLPAYEATGKTPRVGDGTVPGSSDNQAGNSAYRTVSTEAEWKSLPAGSKFVWGPTGQKGTR